MHKFSRQARNRIFSKGKGGDQYAQDDLKMVACRHASITVLEPSRLNSLQKGHTCPEMLLTCPGKMVAGSVFTQTNNLLDLATGCLHGSQERRKASEADYRPK